jgi:AcrR family transcriptional regulator
MSRPRRPAAETKRAIIEVAKRHLVERGPDGIRLNDVASEIGVSRQAVLHHFGSRSGLMRAVVEQAWVGLFRDVAGLAESADGLSHDGFVDYVDDVVRQGGNARLGAWLLLSNEGLPADLFKGALSSLPGAMTDGENKDAQYVMLLVGAALFGDAIFGERLRQAFGLPDGEEERLDFRRWMARRLWTDDGRNATSEG